MSAASASGRGPTTASTSASTLAATSGWRDSRWSVQVSARAVVSWPARSSVTTSSRTSLVSDRPALGVSALQQRRQQVASPRRPSAGARRSSRRRPRRSHGAPPGSGGCRTSAPSREGPAGCGSARRSRPSRGPPPAPPGRVLPPSSVRSNSTRAAMSSVSRAMSRRTSRSSPSRQPARSRASGLHHRLRGRRQPLLPEGRRHQPVLPLPQLAGAGQQAVAEQPRHVPPEKPVLGELGVPRRQHLLDHVRVVEQQRRGGWPQAQADDVAVLACHAGQQAEKIAAERRQAAEQPMPLRPRRHAAHPPAGQDGRDAPASGRPGQLQQRFALVVDDLGDPELRLGLLLPDRP